MNKSVPSSAKQQREITSFTVLNLQLEHKTTNLYFSVLFNVAHTNPLVAYFANNIECEQDGTIEDSHDWAGVYFK